MDVRGELHVGTLSSELSKNSSITRIVSADNSP
jgi:hypothetical protein